MALRGIAVLTYDKRGVGKSGGAPGRADDISAANLALFAADAATAMRWVSDNSRVRTLPRGFVAISQSGWVIPLALAKSPTPDFLGFWSGPTCTTSEQLHYQALSAERDYDRARLSDNEIAEAMKHVKYRPDDVNPLKPLGTVSIPSLWLFGGQDPYVPIKLSVQRLSELIGKGRNNFEYRVFPKEGHNLADSTEQESFVAMVEWIKRIASQKSRTSRTGAGEAQQAVPADVAASRRRG